MAGRAWQIAYTSPSILGIQAAVSAGLGVSILPEVAILPEHTVLDAGTAFRPSPMPQWHSLQRRKRTQPPAGWRRLWPTSAALSIRGWRHDR
jgi:DNA-binding transcriptional LysR family regulator